MLLLGLWLLGTGSGCGLLIGLEPFGPAAEAGAVADGGVTDAGPTDRSGHDAIRPDGQRADMHTVDGPMIDTAAPDRLDLDAAAQDAPGPDRLAPDAAAQDSSTRDVLPPDSSTPDAAHPDFSLPDAWRPDGAQPDLAQPDTAQPDTAQPDTAQPDAAQPDAAQPDTAQPDASPPASCGTVGIYQDNFDDDFLGPIWGDWHEPGCALQEQDGRLEVHVGDYCYASAYTEVPVSLVGDSFSVELVQLPSSDDSEAYIQFYVDELNYVVLQQYGQVLHFGVVDQGEGWGGSSSFDEGTMRWLSIGEEEGQVVFSTSAQGQLWTELDRTSAPSFVRSGTVSLGGGSWGNVTDVVAFDNLNAGRVPLDWCPTSALRDDFQDGTLDVVWTPPGSSGCGWAEQSGVLRLSATQRQRCTLATSQLYLFDGSEVVVEVVSGAPSEAGAFAGLALWAPSTGASFYMGIRDGQLIGDDEQVAAPFSVPLLGRRWLRVRRSGDRTYFYASTDGAGWQLLSTPRHQGTIGPLYVLLSADCRGCNNGTAAVVVQFDNYNYGQ